MKTLRLVLSPLAGAVVGVIVNLLLIVALALLAVRTFPLWAAAGNWGVRLHVVGEQVAMFGLSGLAAGAVAGLIAGREAGRVLGMLAGLLTWIAHVGMALSQSGPEMMTYYMSGNAAALYGVGLVAAVAGGYLGARVATKPRAVGDE